MDDYFMDQIIGSYDECFFGTEDCGGGWYNDFTVDHNFYHYRVKFKLVSRTDKAYLFETKEGQFWCPRSLLRNVKVSGDGLELKGLLWDGFEPTFIKAKPPVVDEFDIEEDDPEPVVIKKLRKRLKPMKKKKIVMLSTPTGSDDSFIKDFLGVE